MRPSDGRGRELPSAEVTSSGSGGEEVHLERRYRLLLSYFFSLSPSPLPPPSSLTHSPPFLVSPARNARPPPSLRDRAELLAIPATLQWLAIRESESRPCRTSPRRGSRAGRGRSASARAAPGKGQERTGVDGALYARR